ELERRMQGERAGLDPQRRLERVDQVLDRGADDRDADRADAGERGAAQGRDPRDAPRAGRPPRPRAGVPRRHPGRPERAAAGRRAGPGGRGDGYRANPAGTGSSGSSRYWPIPVIQARPVISGTTAGRPATDVSSTSRPVKRVPITDSLTNGAPTASAPRACSW